MTGANSTDPNLMPATELASLIRQGKVSAADALEGAIERYERFNPAVNAVILTRVVDARERAAAADAALAAGECWGPLHGVPMTIKEAFDWAGTPSTWGNPAWAANMADTDAVTVSRLQQAGAVIWGKTNVPLLLGDWQSFNDVYGCTNNPWDLTRVPGGSSGGSAVALATGMASLELGSDIGASIRNPAHYCGVFGHKPTFGLVPDGGSRHTWLPGRHRYRGVRTACPKRRRPRCGARRTGRTHRFSCGRLRAHAAGRVLRQPRCVPRRGDARHPGHS